MLILATKGYGLTIEDVDMSSPADIKPYLEAYKLQRNEKDILQWELGQYILAAISTIGKGKYPKEPMFQIGNSIEKNIEKDIQKAILAEQQYMLIAANKGLPQIIIK